MSVIETDVAAVQVSDAGATSRVNNYRILGLLGEGAFSRVYECEDGDGQHFALKVLNKSFLKRKREYKRVDGKLVLSNAFQKVQKEVAIMKKLSHAHLVKLHEVIDSPADDKMFLVLDLIRGGQVMDWDNKSFSYRSSCTPTGVLGRAAVRACLRDVVVALDYLHRNRICHRDIKPENILLSSAEEGYKLADFGVAHMLEPEGETNREQSMIRSTEGTYHFLAPECTTGDAYDPFQVDIWALGVTMFAMLKGTLPFGTNAASLDAVMTSIREDALVLPDDLSPECTELLTRMLTKSPSERITIPQLLSHSWLWDSSVIPPTPRGGGDGGEAQGEEGVVEVTVMEIEAAFTPVNNFILMTKLKMKMGSRLARARKSIDYRQEVVGNGGALARRLTQPHGPAAHPQLPHHRSSDGMIAVLPLSDISSVLNDVAKDDTKTDDTLDDGKLYEVSSSEVSPGKPGLQKRKSNIVEALSGTMDALASMKPATLLRRNSALASSPAKSKLGDQSIPTAVLLSALPINQLEKLRAAPNAEEGSAGVQSEAPTREAASPDTAVPVSNRATGTAGDEGLIDFQPIVSYGRPTQPQLLRRDLPRSSTVARIDNTSSPTFSDITASGALVRRKSGLPSMSSPQSPRSRSVSPFKAVRLGKLVPTAEKFSHHPRVDEPPALQQPCDAPDARDEASEGSTLLSVEKSHGEDSLELDANVDEASNPTTTTLTALATGQEIIYSVGHSPTKPTAGGDAIDVEVEDGRGSRPQSPRSRRQSSVLGSHPPLQAKLPPLDVSSAPSTPTTRSPLASPVAAGPPQRPRRSFADLPLRTNDTEGLSTVEEGLPLPLSPGRRHSMLDRPPSLEHHALPAFSVSQTTLSTTSSPRENTISHLSEGELPAEPSRSGMSEEGADSSVQPLPPDDEETASTVRTNLQQTEGISPLSRDTQGSLKLTFSLSTPHLPRYHSLTRPDEGSHQTSLAGESPSGLSSSSSTSSLSPRHKLPSPSRFHVAPLVRETRVDRPSPPTVLTVPMVRMSSLAKALDDCLAPEDNATFYSFRSAPWPQTPAVPASDESSTAVENPSVISVVDEGHLALRRRSSVHRSLLETQDSLKLMTNGAGSPARSPPSPKLLNALQRRFGGWTAGRGAANPPRTAVCVLM